MKKPLTKEEIEKFLTENFYGLQTVPLPIVRTDEEVQTIIDSPDSKYHNILSGYHYRIGEPPYVNRKGIRNVVAMTGQGGAQAFFKEILKQGLSEEEALAGIFISFKNYGWIPMTRLKIIQNLEEDEP